MEAAAASNVPFWGLAAVLAWGLHRDTDARPRSLARGFIQHGRHAARGRDARLAGLVLGVLCARFGWLVVHAAAVSEAAGESGGWRALLGAPVGVSVLFAPLGPVLVRALRRDPHARLDGDLRAWVLGLAVARLGCAWADCCGGRDVTQLGLLTTAGSSWLAGWAGFAYPVALHECLGLAGLWAGLRRAGLGGLAIAGFGALRLGLEPLRAPPPHGGPTGWVAWVAGAWVAFGVAFALAPHVRGRVSWAKARLGEAAAGRAGDRLLRGRRPRRRPRAAHPTTRGATSPPGRRRPSSAR